MKRFLLFDMLAVVGGACVAIDADTYFNSRS